MNLLIEGNYNVPVSGYIKIRRCFSNTDNSLLATQFLNDGVKMLASIGRNINETSPKILWLAGSQAQFVVTDDEAKTINSFSLNLANGNSVSITFCNSDKGHPVTNVRDLGRYLLNSGVTLRRHKCFHLLVMD